MYNTSNDEKSHQQIKEFLKKEYDLDEKNAKLVAEVFFNQSLIKNNEVINSLIDNKESANIKEFKLEVLKLINYLKIHLEKNKKTLIYLTRIGNLIKYGEYNNGIKLQYNTIKMNSDTDFKNIYLTLQKEFFPIFTKNYKHTFFNGYNLLVKIGTNITIDINSNNKFDKKWLREEINEKTSNSYTKELIQQNIRDMMSVELSEEDITKITGILPILYGVDPKIIKQNVHNMISHNYIEEKLYKLVTHNHSKNLTKKKKD